MPTYQYLTDRTLAQTTAITPTTLIHIVTTADTTQSIYGSSYKAELQQLQDIFGSNPDVTVTGGTYNPSTGEVTFYNNTGGTFNVSGFVTGFTDSFVSGGTYSSGTATFTNTTGGTFTVTGFTIPFSGGSGDCIADLYVSNIHSCSPLNINPLDEGNVYFGSTSGVTVDLTNVRLGIGTESPEYRFVTTGSTGYFYYDGDEVRSPYRQSELAILGPSSGITNVSVKQFPTTGKTIELAMLVVGDETSNSLLWRGFGNSGDTAIYASSSANDLNIINGVGSGTTDNINFFAGSVGNIPNSTPDLHIHGSGTTKGYVGVGTKEPTQKLHISGNTRHSGNVYMDNTNEISWSDTSLTWPTSINNRIRWALNNDSASIYAFQSAADDIDFVFKIADNAQTSVDNYVFWVDDYTGEQNDRYPLEMNGTSFIVNPLRRYATIPANSGAGNTDFYILQSGATSQSQSVVFADVSEAKVGINTSSPSETLDVNGKTKTANFQMTSGATSDYVLTSDASGNASWQIPAVTGDTNFANTNLTFTGNRDHNTDGNRLSITTDNGLYGEGWIYLDKSIGGNNGSWIGYASNYIRSFNQGNQIFSSDGVLANIVEFFTGGTTFNVYNVPNVYFNVRTNSDPYSLYIDGTSGYVGIGTDTPIEKLEISGSTRINNTSSGATSGLILDNISGQSRSQIVLKSNNTFLWRFGLTSLTGNTNFNFYNGVNDVLTLDPESEQVGIGVNPITYGTQAKLHINNTTTGTTFLAEDSTNPDSSPFVIDNEGRVGIGTSSPSYKLQVNGTYGSMSYDPNRVRISGNTDLGTFDSELLLFGTTSGATVINLGSGNISFGTLLIGKDFTGTTIYGVSGDTALFQSSEAKNLNIVNSPGTGNDNIRFYAGQIVSGATPDMHIQGNGSTRGFVGIGTATPTQKLDVSGNALISGGMSASTITITNPYVPTGSTDPTGTTGTISWSGNTLYFRNTTGWVRITGQTSW